MLTNRDSTNDGQLIEGESTAQKMLNQKSISPSPSDVFVKNSSILVPKTRFTRVMGDEPIAG